MFKLLDRKEDILSRQFFSFVMVLFTNKLKIIVLVYFFYSNVILVYSLLYAFDVIGSNQHTFGFYIRSAVYSQSAAAFHVF